MRQLTKSRNRPRTVIMLAMLACAVTAGGIGLGAIASRVGKPPPPPPPPPPPATQPSTQPASQPATEKLVIAGEEFELEIAATPESRELGLMNRDHIDEHGGMLFIYPWPQVLSYWMKNCPIEMDILFLNDKGVIIAMHRMQPAPPRRAGQTDEQYDNALPRYDSRRPAQFAIELRAGTIQRLKIKAGDKIEMELKRLVKLASEQPD